jgi:cytochrome c556
MKRFWVTGIALAFAASAGGAMAQADNPSATPSATRMAAMKQQFQATERGWQEESMSSASAPLNNGAQPVDSTPQVRQALVDKVMNHAVEAGAVANAAVNTKPVNPSMPNADPMVSRAGGRRIDLNEYEGSIQRDAKP